MKSSNVWPFLYNVIAVPMMEAALYVSRFLGGKAAAASRGRRRTITDTKNPLRPLSGRKPRLWFHAASAGEFLQITPLIERMRNRYKDGAIFITFFSPSAEKLTSEYPHKDVALYLPTDSRTNIRKLLTAFKPDIILFSKYDVWPNLAWESAKAGVKLGIVGATIHERSGRLRCGISSLYRRVHGVLDFVGTSTEDDAALYMKLNVDPGHIAVTGDMRYDQTFQRAMSVSPDDPTLVPLRSEAKVFVAGSTWPEDDRILIPAFVTTRKKHGKLKLIIVPHEIDKDKLEETESLARGHELTTVRYSSLQTGKVQFSDFDVAVVDEVGFLAKVYSLGTVAYVGGGFGAGVHNVMEPACFGLPVFMGPGWFGSREASQMLKRAGAFAVKKPDGLANLLTDLLDREEWRCEAGEKALEVVKENLGATDNTIEELNKRFPSIFES